MISPIRLGLDGVAQSQASPRDSDESSSPDTILGHKSNYLELQLLGSPRGRPTRARAWPPQWGSVRVGSVCVAGRVSDRGRQPRSQSRAEAGPLPWGPDPTGGSAAASGPPGRTGPPRGRCGGGCGGRLRYRTLHYANARVRTPTDHGLSVSIPISGVSA